MASAIAGSSLQVIMKKSPGLKARDQCWAWIQPIVIKGILKTYTTRPRNTEHMHLATDTFKLCNGISAQLLEMSF